MPELDSTLLGGRIRQARKECGHTQQELADQTGLAVKTVQDIEKGRKNPTYETLARLMERLGVSPDAAFHSETIAPTEEMKDFIEMCFDPNSPVNGRLKEALFNMLKGAGEK